MSCRPLERAFYIRPTAEVARALLGKILVHGAAQARIVETEAYLGLADAAAHAYGGRTPRTEVLFGPPGHAYVYLIYGIYECLNIVAEPEGQAGCVLIRAVEPVKGIESMRRRRPGIDRLERLANGPGKLTLAMGITRRHNGADLTRGPLAVCGGCDPTFEIGVSRRIGITKNPDALLRFYIAGSPFVSR
ncbi:MAG TPA: DNA-3-methyladenine glycosylase [Bryobacteraceae bacterium]|nr:DNA-3-methyladenine glycosylase [Bryobacteraceae bacterium]